jgi:hypothetical protein
MREDIRAFIGDLFSQDLGAVWMLLRCRCPWDAIMFLRRWVTGRLGQLFKSKLGSLTDWGPMWRLASRAAAAHHLQEACPSYWCYRWLTMRNLKAANLGTRQPSFRSRSTTDSDYYH